MKRIICYFRWFLVGNADWWEDDEDTIIGHLIYELLNIENNLGWYNSLKYYLFPSNNDETIVKIYDNLLELYRYLYKWEY